MGIIGGCTIDTCVDVIDTSVLTIAEARRLKLSRRALAADASAQAWLTLAVLFVAVALSYTDRFVLNVLLIPIRADLRFTDVGASLLQGAAFALVYAVACIPMGALADRVNRRNLIGVGAVIWCAGTGACGLAHNFPEFFAARVAVGLGEACLFPAAVSILADDFPPTRRGFTLGILFVGTSVGGGASVALGGRLLAVFAAHPWMDLSPWRATLLCLALGGLLVPVLLLTLVREPARTEDDAEPRNAASWRAAAAFFSGNRRILVCGLAATAAVVLTDYGVAAWTPTFLVRHFALALPAISEPLGLIMLVGGGLGTLAGAAATDWVAARFGEPARLRAAAAAIVVTLPTLSFVLVNSPKASLLLFAPYVFLIAFAGMAGTVGVQALAPARLRGLLIGVQAFMQVSIGLSLGPTLIALTTDRVLGDPTRVGTAMFIVALAALLVALSLLAGVGRRSTRRSECRT
jgi:MFS family permease